MPSVPSEFLHDGALFLAPHLSLLVAGNEGKVRLEAGSHKKEVDYDNINELIKFRMERFQTAHVTTATVKNVDFNRVSADNIEKLFEGVITEKFEIELEREQNNPEAFILIQKLEDRSKIVLKMNNFCLAPEQLLALKPARHIMATGDISPPVDDATALALIAREHDIIDIDGAFQSPESIRDAFKKVDSNDVEQVIIMNLSRELFDQFTELIGLKMVDGELVVDNEKEGFTVANDNGVDSCIGDHTIFFERASGMLLYNGLERGKWHLTIAKMMKKREEDREDSEESDDESDEESDESLPSREPTEFIEDGVLYLAPGLEFTIAGNEGKIRLEVGSYKKEVNYEDVEELIEFRLDSFETAHAKKATVKNVDFNRVSAENIEKLFEDVRSCEEFEIELEREQNHPEAFALIQKLEDHAKICLKMNNFCLAPEQLLLMKRAWQITATGDFAPPDDETVLALIAREHEIIDIAGAFQSPEAVRDAFKLVASNEEWEQVVAMVISNELFTQFTHLIGVRMVDGILVVENEKEGFTVANKKSGEKCIGDHMIFFNLATAFLVDNTEESGAWKVTLHNERVRELNGWNRRGDSEESESDGSDDSDSD